jgi:ABC-type Fe3+/spermidine/putrescine transport system ATPase subunit
MLTSGTVEQIYINPHNLYAARFLGYDNIFHASLIEIGRDATKLDVGGVILRTSKNYSGEAHVGIHGDDIILRKITPRNVQDNVFSGLILDTLNIGPSVTVKIDIGVELTINMSKRRFWEMGLDVGERTWVQFPPEAVKPLHDQTN